MKSLVVLGLVVSAFALVCSGVHIRKLPTYFTDDVLVMKQKAIFDVLQHVHQNNLSPELRSVADNFNFADYLDHFTDVDVAKKFFKMYKFGLLPMNEIFSIMDETHNEQAVLLFQVFYYARDWDTFYKVMKWARFYVNEGMFIYALTAAVFHREDMSGLVMPAMYEIYPYYFFNSDAIQKAQLYKMQGFSGMKKTEGTYAMTVMANYTAWLMDSNVETKLSYFTEDIGLNSYYYYFHMDYPHWMEGKEYGLDKDRRGELYLYYHQQLLARYYMERLSVGLGDIPDFSFYDPIVTGYYPSLRYYTGEFFSGRSDYYKGDMHNVDTYFMMEHRIRDALDLGYVMLRDGTFIDLTKPESIEQLGSFVQGNPDTKLSHYFGFLDVYAKMMLGASKQTTKGKTVPGVLYHYETALRDPMFYQMFKRFMDMFYWAFMSEMDSYTMDELKFDGVEIESVEVPDLVTYYDKFEADITNAVDVEMYHEKDTMGPMYKYGRRAHYEGEDMLISARQWRLNHLPFSIDMNVMSDKAQKAMVKIFIGPKTNEFGHVLDMNENRKYFFELDYFMYELKPGMNNLVRSCMEFTKFAQDRTTYFELYKMLMKGGNKFPLYTNQEHCKFPWRLMLPKGQRGGMPFQFFFMVMPFDELEWTEYSKVYESCGVGTGHRYPSKRPFGYPLDRDIDYTNWYTPNMYYRDVKIFNKRESEVNMVTV